MDDIQADTFVRLNVDRTTQTDSFCFPPEILTTIISFVSDDVYHLKSTTTTCKSWFDISTSMAKTLRVHRYISVECVLHLVLRYPRLELLDLALAPCDVCIAFIVLLLEAAAGGQGQQAPFSIKHFPRHMICQPWHQDAPNGMPWMAEHRHQAARSRYAPSRNSTSSTLSQSPTPFFPRTLLQDLLQLQARLSSAPAEVCNVDDDSLTAHESKLSAFWDCSVHFHFCNGKVTRPKLASGFQPWDGLFMRLCNASPASATVFIQEFMFSSCDYYTRGFISRSIFIPLCTSSVISDLFEVAANIHLPPPTLDRFLYFGIRGEFEELSLSRPLRVYNAYSSSWSREQQLAFFHNAIVHDLTDLLLVLRPIILPDIHAVPPALLCGALHFTEGHALYALLQYGPLCPYVTVPEVLMTHLLRGMTKPRNELVPILQCIAPDPTNWLQLLRPRLHNSSPLLRSCHAFIEKHGKLLWMLLPSAIDFNHHWPEVLNFCCAAATDITPSSFPYDIPFRGGPAFRLLEALQEIPCHVNVVPFAPDWAPGARPESLPPLLVRLMRSNSGGCGWPFNIDDFAAPLSSTTSSSSTQGDTPYVLHLRAMSETVGDMEDAASLLCLLLKEMVTRSQERAAYLREAMTPRDPSPTIESLIAHCVNVARDTRLRAYEQPCWRKMMDPLWTPGLRALQAGFEALMYGNPASDVDDEEWAARQELLAAEDSAFQWIMTQHGAGREQFIIQRYYAELCRWQAEKAARAPPPYADDEGEYVFESDSDDYCNDDVMMEDA